MKNTFEKNEGNLDKEVFRDAFDRIMARITPEEKAAFTAEVDQMEADWEAMTPEEQQKRDIDEYIETYGAHGGYEEEAREDVKGREMPKTHSKNIKR